MLKTFVMDPLENRIKDLQDALQQVEQPDRLAIWAGVSPSPPVKATWVRRLPWRSAAAALALLLAGTSLGYWWNETRHRRLEAARFAELPPEWQAKVQVYQVLVGRQEAALKVNSPRGATAADERRELEVLDSLQAAFLADFETLPKDQRTAERFLRYYEQKNRILELILKEIQIRNHEAEKQAQLHI